MGTSKPAFVVKSGPSGTFVCIQDYDSTRQAYEAEKNKLREEEHTLKAKLEEQDPLKQQLAKMADHEEGLRRLDKSLVRPVSVEDSLFLEWHRVFPTRKSGQPS